MSTTPKRDGNTNHGNGRLDRPSRTARATSRHPKHAGNNAASLWCEGCGSYGAILGSADK